MLCIKLCIQITHEKHERTPFLSNKPKLLKGEFHSLEKIRNIKLVRIIFVLLLDLRIRCEEKIFRPVENVFSRTIDSII